MLFAGDSNGERDLVLYSSRPQVIRLVLYSVAIGVLALGVVSAVLRVPRQVELKCTLRSTAIERVYRFAEDVFVEQYYVRPGELVRRGQPLVRISSPQIAALVIEHTLARLQEEVFENTELPIHAKTQTELRLKQEKVLQQPERTQQTRRFALATKQAEIRKHELAVRTALE